MIANISPTSQLEKRQWLIIAFARQISKRGFTSATTLAYAALKSFARTAAPEINHMPRKA
jgi:hypothetical protein